MIILATLGVLSKMGGPAVAAFSSTHKQGNPLTQNNVSNALALPVNGNTFSRFFTTIVVGCVFLFSACSSQSSPVSSIAGNSHHTEPGEVAADESAGGEPGTPEIAEPQALDEKPENSASPGTSGTVTGDAQADFPNDLVDPPSADNSQNLGDGGVAVNPALTDAGQPHPKIADAGKTGDPDGNVLAEIPAADAGNSNTPPAPNDVGWTVPCSYPGDCEKAHIVPPAGVPVCFRGYCIGCGASEDCKKGDWCETYEPIPANRHPSQTHSRANFGVRRKAIVILAPGV